jgi:uncharacterized protein YprB with RNaseH-like and TPR domain
MKLKDIRWAGRHRCKHGHTYIEHWNCYLDEVGGKEIVGYLDIEASNLKANFGIIYCYCIKVGNSDEIIERTITKKELDTCLDKRVVSQCLRDIAQFDRLFTYFGSRFDIKFIKTRAMYHGLDAEVLSYGNRFHRDLYDVAKRNLATHSRRLEVVAETILPEELYNQFPKTKLDPRHWIKAMGGNKKALKYIVEHCRNDVRLLEAVHKVLDPFYLERDTSI